MIRIIIEKNNFYEMANYSSNDTGLLMNIFLSIGNSISHGPRIKVQNNYSNRVQPNNFFTIKISRIDDNYITIGNIGEIKQKDINKIYDYIKINKKIILDFWDGNINSVNKLSELLQKV